MNRDGMIIFSAAAILNLITVLAIGYFTGVFVPAITYIFIGALAVATMLMYAMMLNAHRTQNGMFISFFMLSVLVKMMVTLGLLFGYLYFHPEHKLVVALSFLSTYFLFTIIEVVLLYRKMQKN